MGRLMLAVSALGAIWRQFKPATLERVGVLEAAAEALRDSQLTPELRLRAEREAHTLAGSVGSLGFVEGARLARQAESLLGRGAALGPAQAERLFDIVATI